MSDRFITLAEVRHRTALSKTEIYRRIAAGTFPRSIPLGRWKVVWRESQVNAWMQAQEEAAGAERGRRDRVARSRRAIEARTR